MTIIASAPGKVILFGEHAVVHGSHAVAAALSSLRVFARLEPRSDNRVRIELLDLGVWWEDETSALGITRARGEAPEPPPSSKKPNGRALELARRLEAPLVAVAYLCAELCDAEGATLAVKSGGLPAGAGLGSSAAVAVACAAALCVGATGALRKDVANAWAFAAEVVQHGRPSGLDNALSCYGGGVVAVRRGAGLERNTLEIPPLKLLITNTRVARSTKELVAKVAAEFEAAPGPVRRLFDAIDTIALDFASACRENRVATPFVARLVRLNHALLRALGASHPALEAVADMATEAGAPATKLTGAGGGGCAITLLHDAEGIEIADDKVRRLVQKLRRRGFDCYQTDLGGPGVRCYDDDDDDEPPGATPFDDDDDDKKKNGSSRPHSSSLAVMVAAVVLLLSFALLKNRAGSAAR
ncbi:hypothetical protein CTAYLR_000976 [Chrysophaeum taylorii]|uniref:Mevalonate kinase n=1 Tax=Chrysophaeum taylorii TaxID=2483200 RepID=A0AAD7UFB5_9STRA|nr:hypothetical protein CTAYLR_000976 [Chrysophaeum taylorii]